MDGWIEVNGMTKYVIEQAGNLNSLSRLAAQLIASHIDLALDQRDRCQIALSGGSTPSDTYRFLAQEHLPWDRVDVFLADERWVGINDDSSNARLIQETLLSSLPGSDAKFYPVQTTELPSPEASAADYEDLIRNTCLGEPPIFDLILLGIGADGHTASLFPGTNSLHVIDRSATVSTGKGLDRITLTAPVLSSARKVFFLVSGKGKQEALKRLLDDSESSERTPAKLVRPNSEVIVLVDETLQVDL